MKGKWVCLSLILLNRRVVALFLLCFMLDLAAKVLLLVTLKLDRSSNYFFEDAVLLRTTTAENGASLSEDRMSGDMNS